MAHNINYRREVKDWDSLIREIETIPTTLTRLSSESRSENSWAGTKSFEEAMNLVRGGWQEGSDKIMALSERFKSHARLSGSLKKDDNIEYDYAGEFVDVNRYLCGEVECFGTYVHEIVEKEGNVVRLMANISASSGIDTKIIENRGAAIAALIDLLESCGRSVEISVCDMVTGGWGAGGAIFVVRVKDAGQPLDFGRMAFALCHPSMLRRIMFRLNEQSPKNIIDNFGFEPGGGYGTPADLFEELGEEFDVKMPSLKYGEHSFLNESGVIEWILGKLEQLGIEIED